ncbi:hypothetical protein AVEN_149860-1 [Araneus ventricosus]|uniref:HTH CENPB-type domain-containing protein n=1 Tax=Araneus ventricosus TaxID=182803 RepID=A0A4Y2DWJ1_ARAVE|nr:hypothetical protein AVEN_149860-1 [Araneus ventricosus]
MEKAQEISKKLNVECSSGWLHKFKLRHGITGKTVSGESGDLDCETVDDWIQNQLPNLIKGYEQRHFQCRRSNFDLKNQKENAPQFDVVSTCLSSPNFSNPSLYYIAEADISVLSLLSSVAGTRTYS